MSLSLAALQQTCDRQLERLRSTNLERHELLDIATTLMLLIGSMDAEAADDVVGHDLSGRQRLQPDELAASRADLAWVRSQGRTGSHTELGDRTRRAAKELCLQLRLRPTSERNV
jgi:hypothetical protein